MDDIDDSLNAKALMALLGFSITWKDDLVSLLRSKVPISPAVRGALADAVEGSQNIKLSLSGHQSSARRIEGIETRRRWFETGKSVAQIVDKHKNVLTAFYEASLELDKSEDDCRKQYYYFKNCSEWVAANRKHGVVYSQMTDNQLEGIWHISAINQDCDRPSPPTAEEYDELHRKRMTFFKAMFGEWQHADIGAHVFTTFCELYPPETR